MFSHELAKNLSSIEDEVVTASCGDEEYMIDGIKTIKTCSNYDDSYIYHTLMLRKINGNIKR